MHSTQVPLNKDYTHAVEGAIDAHEKSDYESGGANPIISHGRVDTFSDNTEEAEATLPIQRVRNNLHTKFTHMILFFASLSYNAGYNGGGIYSCRSYVEPPMGRFRTELFDCCRFPYCLLAFCFPWVIWAQAHKVLHGGVVDREKGMRGYYVIMGSFIVMTFIISLAGVESSVPFFTAVQSLYSILGTFILLSLLRRARKKYNIHGNHCQTCCCGCCSDGCYDLLKAFLCPYCTTFQLGHHLFDYSTNTEITYEALPTIEHV